VIVKNVSTRWSPSLPVTGASANLTRAAYVPWKNLRWWNSSAWLVPPAVPSVDACSCNDFAPSTVGNETFDAGHDAPGTPGPPALVRTVQPRWPMSGSAGPL
jgi:hypothetical protein